MNKLKKVLAWCKKYIVLLSFGLGALLMVLFKLLSRDPGPAVGMEKSPEIDRIKEDILTLEAEKKILSSEVERDEKAVVEVDKKLVSIDEQIATKREEINKFDAEQQAKAFKDLGY